MCLIHKWGNSPEIPDCSENPYTPDEFWDLLLDVDNLEEALRLILPMAKGYAAMHDVGSNKKYIEKAERLLTPNNQVQRDALNAGFGNFFIGA